ncbi:12451_t:CDS:2, partial [Gigaspora rosea]
TTAILSSNMYALPTIEEKQINRISQALSHNDPIRQKLTEIIEEITDTAILAK